MHENRKGPISRGAFIKSRYIMTVMAFDRLKVDPIAM
jgi:hypothetical protein